ncbi:chemotaxis protein CheD [Aestuariivita boseongensis]|uniref:chemotaxis protein CheD n=1 Tax=Aestuariivita boseongensis TaxID=1470562 RepID=UPI0006817694|nr:chemotaxis protein CheD [Aestuariivita boseongensis]
MSYAPNGEMWSTHKVLSVVQGQYRVTRDPGVAMSTILGSCVSVALFDRSSGVGGINHFLLPSSGRPGCNEVKFGAMANELLINELLKMGASRSHLRAKIFGGANIVERLGDIGSRNVSFAQDYMKREGIRIEQADTGGRQARRLHFHPVSGEAKVFTIPIDQTQTLAARERPRQAPAHETDVTLF